MNETDYHRKHQKKEEQQAINDMIDRFFGIPETATEENENTSEQFPFTGQTFQMRISIAETEDFADQIHAKKEAEKVEVHIVITTSYYSDP